MTTLRYDGDADLRYGTAQIRKGEPFEVADADVQPMCDRYGCELVEQEPTRAARKSEKETDPWASISSTR